jgi:hypothetical protein
VRRLRVSEGVWEVGREWVFGDGHVLALSGSRWCGNGVGVDEFLDGPARLGLDGCSQLLEMTTMLNSLEQSGGRYGLQTMCEAGGMANATIIE